MLQERPDPVPPDPGLHRGRERLQQLHKARVRQEVQEVPVAAVRAAQELGLRVMAGNRQ